MKWIAIVVLFVVTLVGCKKEPLLDPINPIVKKFTITAVAGEGGRIDPSGTTSVEAGSSKAYTIIPNNNYGTKTVKINGVIQSIAGNTLELNKVLEDKKIEVDFAPINNLLLCGTPWYLMSSSIQFEIYKDTTWYSNVLDERSSTDYELFKIDNNKYYKYDGHDILIGGPYDWSLNDGVLIVANLTFHLISLTKEELIYTHDDGGGVVEKRVYRHK